MLKPLGFVLATGLHNLLSKTATHVFECLRHALGTKPYDVPYAMTVVKTFLRSIKSSVKLIPNSKAFFGIKSFRIRLSMSSKRLNS